MSLELLINDSIKESMKAKTEARTRALRAIKAELILLKTDGSSDGITEERGVKVLQKMVKQREDSLAVFEQQKREDLAVIEREELVIIREFLPKPLSEDELTALIQNIITQVGASSPKDMGKVMSEANKQIAGRADGKVVSAMVKKLLG
jgi:uncharacterized protein YqeY